MTNVKIGMKLFRNVEAMPMGELMKVTNALKAEMERLEKASKGMNMGNSGVIMNSFTALTKHQKLLENLARKRMGEHMANKPLTVEAGTTPTE